MRLVSPDHVLPAGRAILEPTAQNWLADDHHVTHLADGGTTSVDGCALYCFFHHHVAIHQWGWTVALHPDGTTTARSPDGTKTLHSHGPPARAG